MEEKKRKGLSRFASVRRRQRRGADALATTTSTMRLLKRIDQNVETFSPTWDHNELIFRPLPGVLPDPENGKLAVAPYRYTTDFLDFGPWIEIQPSVSYFGAKGRKTSFLLYDTAQTADDDAIQMEHPYYLLYNAVRRVVRAVKSPMSSLAERHKAAEWTPLIEGRDALITRPAMMAFMQGIVFRHGGKSYYTNGNVPLGFADTHPVVVIQIKGTAASALVSQLNEMKENADRDGDDWEAMYVHGEVSAWEPGRFICVRRAGEAQQADDDVEINYSAMAQAVRGGKSKIEDNRYEISITRKLTVGGNPTKNLATMPPSERKRLQKRLVPWSDLLRFESMETQAVWIAQALATDPTAVDAIAYAWADHSEYLQLPEVQKVLKQSVSTGSSGRDTVDWSVEASQAPGKSSKNAFTMMQADLESDEYETDEDDDADNIPGVSIPDDAVSDDDAIEAAYANAEDAGDDEDDYDDVDEDDVEDDTENDADDESDEDDVGETEDAEDEDDDDGADEEDEDQSDEVEETESEDEDEDFVGGEDVSAVSQSINAFDDLPEEDDEEEEEEEVVKPRPKKRVDAEASRPRKKKKRSAAETPQRRPKKRTVSPERSSEAPRKKKPGKKVRRRREE